MAKRVFRVEVTDTFGGDANYSWVKRFKVEASTVLGAIGKVSREMGYSFRKEYDSGDFTRYKAQRAAVCAFVEEWDEEAHKNETHRTV
jgi:hypothetical protein